MASHSNMDLFPRNLLKGGEPTKGEGKEVRNTWGVHEVSFRPN